MSTDTKPFGWDVDVTYLQKFEHKAEQYHFRSCSEATAKRKAHRKAIMKHNVTDVIVGKTTPLTEQQWISAYGLGRM